MPKSYSIVVLPGDGIGPDVINEARQTVDAIGNKTGFNIEWIEEAAGGASIDKYGHPLTDEVLDKCKGAHAVLLGAVGGEKWDHHTGEMRPESGLLKLRKGLGAFANLRPVMVPDALSEASPLRAEAVRGTDLLVVRELTGGIYFGRPAGREGSGPEERAYNTMVYTAAEVDRVSRVAFEWARKRSGRVTSVDKANVLVVSQLWRDVISRVHTEDYADISLNHMYVDNAAMQLVLNPGQFDVIVTGNLFGDILSDAAATLGGSLGLLPSASVGGPVGIFEPVHGSAPDIAGKDIANPVGAILSASMMLVELDEGDSAAAIRSGVELALEDGARTADLYRDGFERVSTSGMGDLVRRHALKALK